MEELYRASAAKSMNYRSILALQYPVRRSFHFCRKTLFGLKFTSNPSSHNWPMKRIQWFYVTCRVWVRRSARRSCGIGRRAVCVLGIVANWEGKMVIRSDPMEGHITVRMIPLYWINGRGHGRLGVTLTSLGNM